MSEKYVWLMIYKSINSVNLQIHCIATLNQFNGNVTSSLKLTLLFKCSPWNFAIFLPQGGNTFPMGCWFLICFVLNYPNKQVLYCVYVNNSPFAVENTLGYYIRELNFKKESKNSRTGDRGWYPITCHRQPLQL